MTMHLYLDIETIPAQSEEVRKKIADSVKPPAQMKKAETIEAWERDQKPEAVEEAIAKTALNGAYGHICCIGFALDDNDPSALLIRPEEAGEEYIIRRFFRRIEDGRGIHIPQIVGHNVANFDIRFIWQRCFALGIRVPSWFPRDPKPWSFEVFDTMAAWAGPRDFVSLDTLCSALGIEGKGEIDGSMVGRMFGEGRYNEIAEYCRQDVERVRQVHRKMMVAIEGMAA